MDLRVGEIGGDCGACGLMAQSYADDQTPDRFWRFGFIVGGLLAIAHSARLYEIWAASVVPATLGSGINLSVAAAVARLGLFALLLGAATSQFPTRSRAAFVWLCLAALSLMVAEFDPPALLLMGIAEPLAPSSIVTAWHGGWRLLGESLILIGLAVGLRDIQVAAVRYVYRGN